MSTVKSALVLMPFLPEFENYFRTIFRPALAQAGYRVAHAGSLAQPRPIMDDVRQQICEADLLLAEMTGQNPNVFYELGLAHAVGKPVILVSQHEIPFDLRHVRVLGYERATRAWKHELRQSIQAAAREVERAAETWPPPLVCPKPPRRYGITITSPQADTEVRMGEVAVTGHCELRPAPGSLYLLVASPGGQNCWPQDPARIEDDGTWEGEVRLYGKPGQEDIAVAVVGECGRALIEYYHRAGDANRSWEPIRQLPSDVVIHDRVRIRKRAG